MAKAFCIILLKWRMLKQYVGSRVPITFQTDWIKLSNYYYNYCAFGIIFVIYMHVDYLPYDIYGACLHIHNMKSVRS